MSALSIRGIHKSFGSSPILKGVSLDAEPGEFIALIGPSGCGKSTLLRILAGLETADGGEIKVANRDISTLKAAERNIAMVFQSYALYPHLTAAQNIAVPLVMRRLTRTQRLPFIGSLIPGQRKAIADIKRDVRSMAASLKIDHLLDRKPGQMSGGQRQRVALGRAMVRQPAVFLMDEPLSNLDANLRVHARGEIVDLHRRAGVPTLYVTHDQAEALSMADRVAVMIGGALLQLSPPRVIYDDPLHIEVATFIGQPRINLLPSQIETDSTVALGNVRCALSNRTLSAGAAVTLGIRPEFVRIARGGDSGLPARVERVEFLGSEIIVHSRLDAIGETMIAKVSPAEGTGLAAGMPIRLHVACEHILVFGPDGARQPAMAQTTSVAREAAHGR
ncbi:MULTISPECIES: ABC transporter ATP-binding protein [Rhizobium]|uniref:Sn-glycerol-3-phosphate import ATP-binding protein UgpC n=1 Tax=Rhizobium favelukesii TaxID=348824 RepID=W6S9N0_9HYPH|nr:MULTISPECIES: ABC transporter ATP-binding protein [Rhizobium]MCA0805380.1 ABC transporter ATP-binding protein [Rhizobium sp. T1473]MCS0461845.1 ABC transporter ATP-binding protein [Rhizobium favelukesii]UFS79286.1 ABC transporter ATP-binding protein [Rhizobium sp. T136]CDM62821.1 sn-glycerol-3-phosphate import ATP-binding protein UgpC [Rhizobium favelukesii]